MNNNTKEMDNYFPTVEEIEAMNEEQTQSLYIKSLVNFDFIDIVTDGYTYMTGKMTDDYRETGKLMQQTMLIEYAKRKEDPTRAERINSLLGRQ